MIFYDVSVNIFTDDFLMRNEYSCIDTWWTDDDASLLEVKLNQLFSWPGSQLDELMNLSCLNTHTHTHLDVWNCLMTLMKYWFGSPSFVNKTQLKCTYMLTELYELIPFYVLILQGRILEKDIQARVKVWWTEVLDLVGFEIRSLVEVLCNRKKYLWTFRRVM